MEVWASLMDYPGYSASSLGRVRNDSSDTILAVVRVEGRRCYVGFIMNGRHVKRSLSRVIAETFVPNEKPESFTTPIHLDGDLTNCRASNLMWRPRWFADKYTRQFRLAVECDGPVKNVNTGIHYSSIWDVVIESGVLFMDVVLSAYNNHCVFPLMHYFEWLST